MPLTAKGEEIRGAMEKEYGEKKGEEVFYASRNKGTISGVDGDDSVKADALAGKLETMKKRAQEESKKGYVQHVNETYPGVFTLSDWYDYEQTRASFENGKRLDAQTTNAKLDAALAKSIRADAALSPKVEPGDKVQSPSYKHLYPAPSTVKSQAEIRKGEEKRSDGPVEEAARKANMSVEDYLAQRKKASPGHLRDLQKREMEI
jgi:hypothetical protein